MTSTLGVNSTTKTELKPLIQEIARIRAFEMHLLKLFSEGKLFGTTHTCVGQEACAAALYHNIDSDRDAVFSNHRCHGHFLAYGGSMRDLLAEIMGKAGGVCSGHGGSQHLYYKRFFSTGILGGGVPIAVGYAYQTKKEKKGGITIAHIGDGTLGQGVVYEALNMASILSVPLLIVLEHNGYAQSTDTSLTTAGDVIKRFEAFDIKVDRRRAGNPLELAKHFSDVVAYVRGGRPFVQILDTFRLMPHSKGDDTRPADLIRKGWEEDFFEDLIRRKDAVVLDSWQAAQEEVREITAELEKEPFLKLKDYEPFMRCKHPLFTSSQELMFNSSTGEKAPHISKLLNRALDSAMEADENVLLMGEDLRDPYGGAFKVTEGLSTKYPERVLGMPISEAAIIGFGNGVALSHGKPVAEIMFGDFVTLAMDQLINHTAKIHFMYGKKVSIPITVRLVSGGYRGYGPTHSQSMEGLFCNIPGLKVVALSRRHDPVRFLQTAVLADPNPILFVENKSLYAKRPHIKPPAGFRFLAETPEAPDSYPNLALTTANENEAADVTIVSYGGLTDMVEEAMEHLILEEELDFDYFILSQLSPLYLKDVIKSVRSTRRIITVEEGHERYGVGAEVISLVSIAAGEGGLRVRRVGAVNVPIPSSRFQEDEVLPSKESIVKAVLGIV